MKLEELELSAHRASIRVGGPIAVTVYGLIGGLCKTWMTRQLAILISTRYVDQNIWLNINHSNRIYNGLETLDDLYSGVAVALLL